MKFYLNLGSLDCLEEIMEVQEEAKRTVKKQEWFATDDGEYMSAILREKGFVITAREEESRELAGFFSVYFPGKTENLGEFAGLSGEELFQVVHMDSAAVREKYRGWGLQRLMLARAEEELDSGMKEKGETLQYRMCTVHPDNLYSLRNMEQAGYELITKARLYGGLERYVLCKKVTETQTQNRKL